MSAHFSDFSEGYFEDHMRKDLLSPIELTKGSFDEDEQIGLEKFESHKASIPSTKPSTIILISFAFLILLVRMSIQRGF